MGRVIFLAPYSKTEITGGIKTVYRHAELLSESGIEALIFQPEGHPTWFESRARLVDPKAFSATPDDILVFPESLNGDIGEAVRAPTRGKKILFCQNQYYMTLPAMVAEPDFASRFTRFASSSVIAKHFLERVLHLKDVTVIPCFIDSDLFAPGAKAMEIALAPAKLPREAVLIQKIFQLKYPELKSIPWTFIEKKNERETATILARASVFLSLSFLESFGLVPLEAMASGALVVGFDGYGGREYATRQNGIWLSPDHFEETADALARLIKGLESGAPELAEMRRAGAITAAGYNKNRTRDALRDFYGALLRS